MKPKTTFVEAKPEHFDAVRSMFRTRDDLLYSFSNHDDRFPLQRGYFEKVIKDRIKPTIVLSHGEPVGFGAMYGLKPGRRISLGYIAIHPDHRGCGFAYALVDHLTGLGFNEFAVNEVRLFAANDNLPALLLYKKCGFTPFDLSPTQYPSGNPIALIKMRKQKSDSIGAQEAETRK